MKIKDDWKFKDAVSGLVIEIIKGKELDRLRIKNPDGTIRDFWFDRDGKFDGTGSLVGPCVEKYQEN